MPANLNVNTESILSVTSDRTTTSGRENNRVAIHPYTLATNNYTFADDDGATQYIIPASIEQFGKTPNLIREPRLHRRRHP